jgi:uncharacterized membrane protein YjjP (DUF1212 family)
MTKKDSLLRKLWLVAGLGMALSCFAALSNNDMWMAIGPAGLCGTFAVLVSGKQGTPAGKVVAWGGVLVSFVAFGFPLAARFF